MNLKFFNGMPEKPLIGYIYMHKGKAYVVVDDGSLVQVDPGFVETKPLPKEPEKTGDRKILEEICNNEIEAIRKLNQNY